MKDFNLSDPAVLVPVIVAGVLFVILVAMIASVISIRSDRKKIIADNKKLYSKLNKQSVELKEVVQAGENLRTQYNDLRNRYEQVNRMAFTDKLTDLPNYQQFYELLEGTVLTNRDNEKCALSIIRIANYDRVTNISGHVSADELILDFTNRLRSNITEDDFIARIGDDEFAIITQNFSDVNDFRMRFDSLSELLRTPFESSGQEVLPVLYMASTVFPNDGKTVQLMTLNARLALSYAIDEGKPEVYYYNQAMADEAIKRMEISAGLKSAVETNSFLNLSRAQMDLRNDKVAFFESVPVWENAGYGRLFPEDYLKYTEETLIAKRIFSLVFNATCAKQSTFDRAGYKGVSFITPCFVGQFTDSELSGIVYNALEDSDADPSRMLIAIPETVLAKKPEMTVLLMQKIVKLGVRFVLDDFGSGNSSLKSLTEAPISFVRLSGNLFKNTKEPEKLLRHFTELVHSTDIGIIVPNVNDEKTQAQLKKLKADFGQGELYGGYMNDEAAVQIARITRS